jgi:copper oxidase (laccase) domain-containing protein
VSGAVAVKLAGGGRALFTTRADGNLSSVAGDGAEHGERLRERLRARLGLDGLARGYQVHGSAVRRFTSAREVQPQGGQLGEADGQATAMSGIGTMVLAADCMPVALGCRGAVAMVHAGWRGLAALGELAPGEPIAAVVGPCAGACCYEVGPEVHAAFAGAPGEGRRLDMRAIAHRRLLAAGVATVGDVDACTICGEDYFSHRREGARAGRQAGIAWRP